MDVRVFLTPLQMAMTAVPLVSSMPIFEYKALAGGGATTQGRVEAVGRAEAMGLLEDKGLTPLRLIEIGAGGNAVAMRAAKPAAVVPASNGARKKSGFGFQSKRVPFAALEDFTRSLSSLLTSGVPLSRALTILYKETSNPPAAAKWRELHDAVIDGAPLATAMAKSPDVFPRIYVAMVEAGEAGGFLDVVLAQIAEFQAREKELRAKVSAAMMYPAVLMTLATGVVIFLLVFFIPRFQTLFAGFNATLPLHHAHHRGRERPACGTTASSCSSGVGGGGVVRPHLAGATTRRAVRWRASFTEHARSSAH